MNEHTDIQIIHDRNGAPAFVVLPYADWLASALNRSLFRLPSITFLSPHHLIAPVLLP